jgi:hypothetical protein
MNPSKFIPISDLISLKGKKAIITGGAMGIGFAISYRLAWLWGAWEMLTISAG